MRDDFLFRFSIGWSFFWRLSVWMVLGEFMILAIFLPIALVLKKVFHGNEFFLRSVTPVFFLIFLFLIAYLSDWVGKKVLKIYSLSIPERFIGWEIIWKNFLIMIPVIIVSAIIGSFSKTYLQSSAGAVFLNLVAFMTVLYGYGWTLVQASE